MQEQERSVIERFCQGVIDKDSKQVESVLAPWLCRDPGPEQLISVLHGAALDELRPAGFVVEDIDPMSLEELRGFIQEYYGKGGTRSLRSLESGGDMGPPSIPLPEEINTQNFLAYGMAHLTPAEGANSFIDYCLRLYFVLVDDGSGLKVGWIEPSL